MLQAKTFPVTVFLGNGFFCPKCRCAALVCELLESVDEDGFLQWYGDHEARGSGDVYFRSTSRQLEL